MIIFYLSLWAKYLFRKNFAKEKIFAQTKYRQRKNIGIAKISVLTKYHCGQNIGEEKYRHRKKISVSTKYHQRQNSGEEKILASQKYRFQQNIGGNYGGALSNWWKLRWRVIKSVEIKVAHYQMCGNLGGVKQ